LGTFVEVRARGFEERQIMAAIDRALACVHTVETLMSAHDPKSELGRLYERGALEPVEVHPWTFSVIEASLLLQRLSDGIFNIGVGDVLERNHFLPHWHRRGFSGPATARPDIQLMDGFRIRLGRPVRLDLGGIAKGFAVDRAVEALMEADAESGCVNAGGDFRIFGSQPEPLLLRSPEDPRQLICVGAMPTGAVATSAAYFSRRQRRGSLMTPLVDGRTREPLNFEKSITVIASSCMWADALTKVVAVDLRGSAPLLKHFDARALVLAVNENGPEIHALPSFSETQKDELHKEPRYER
jgi:thiamine biosynthesis lipoprotein